MSRILLDNKATPETERSYQIPWVYDGHAYNMINNMPERTIDITNENWKQEIGNFEEVESLYILVDLQAKDYEIIRQMVNLKALYMYTAKSLADISFLENLTKLKEVMISNSQVQDLSPIVKVRKKQEELNPDAPWWNLQLVAILKSKVSDLSAFGDKISFSEFLLYKSKVSEDDPIYQRLTESIRRNKQKLKGQ